MRTLIIPDTHIASKNILELNEIFAEIFEIKADRFPHFRYHNLAEDQLVHFIGRGQLGQFVDFLYSLWNRIFGIAVESKTEPFVKCFNGFFVRPPTLFCRVGNSVPVMVEKMGTPVIPDCAVHTNSALLVSFVNEITDIDNIKDISSPSKDNSPYWLIFNFIKRLVVLN